MAGGDTSPAGHAALSPRLSPASLVPPPAAGGSGPGADRFGFWVFFLKKRRSGQERGGSGRGSPAELLAAVRRGPALSCPCPGLSPGAPRAGRCAAAGRGSPLPVPQPALQPGRPARERGMSCLTLCNTVGRVFLPRGTHGGRAGGEMSQTTSPSRRLLGAKSEILMAIGFVSLFCFVLFGVFPSFKR